MVLKISHCINTFQVLQITRAQFFQEEDSVYLTKEQKKLLDLWAKLSPAQREAVTKMLCAFLYIEEEP